MVYKPYVTVVLLPTMTRLGAVVVVGDWVSARTPWSPPPAASPPAAATVSCIHAERQKRAVVVMEIGDSMMILSML